MPFVKQECYLVVCDECGHKFDFDSVPHFDTKKDAINHRPLRQYSHPRRGHTTMVTRHRNARPRPSPRHRSLKYHYDFASSTVNRVATIARNRPITSRLGWGQFRLGRPTNKPHRFKGKLSSAERGCKADRTVRIKKMRPGKSARTVATTTTGRKGGFSAKHTRGGKGRYFAQAGKKVFTQDIDTTTCNKARSAKVRSKK